MPMKKDRQRSGLSVNDPVFVGGRERLSASDQPHHRGWTEPTALDIPFRQSPPGVIGWRPFRQ